MENWKKYTNDPKFLIVLLPGLELAHSLLTQEIANIKLTVRGALEVEKEAATVRELTALTNGHAAAPSFANLPQEVKTEPIRRNKTYVKKITPVKEVGEEATPLTTNEMFAKVIKLKGGTATNDDFREFIKKNKDAPKNLLNNSNLSVAVSYAVNKSKQLTRIALGTYQLTQ